MNLEDQLQRELRSWMERAEDAERRDPLPDIIEHRSDKWHELKDKDPISAYGWRKIRHLLAELQDVRATMARLREQGMIDRWNNPCNPS